MPISAQEVPHEDNGDRLLVPVSDDDHIQEGANASVVLVEYGDYQCPDSGTAYRIIQTIRQRLHYQLRFAFRHFPQAQKHPQASKAAAAAEAAAAQGKFWQMHDTLFEHQNALDDSSLVEYANALNLDISQFLRDVSGRAYAQRIIQNIDSGRSSGVVDTPALFINNIRYRDVLSIETLHKAILNICQF